MDPLEKLGVVYQIAGPIHSRWDLDQIDSVQDGALEIDFAEVAP